VKKSARKSGEQSVPFTTKQLREIWERIRYDNIASSALRRLDKAGFQISHLVPRDATFKHPNWTDYIAALPLLPNKPITRRFHSKTEVRKYWPLVRELHRFAAMLNDPFADVHVFGVRDLSMTAIRDLRDDLLKASSTLNHFLSWNYYVRDRRTRNALIAELRSTIRLRTGKPHDRELRILMHASFQAAGHEEGLRINSNALDRIEKRERESRKRANQRVRSLK
jgi:hypothetical protein